MTILLKRQFGKWLLTDLPQLIRSFKGTFDSLTLTHSFHTFLCGTALASIYLFLEKVVKCALT